jgi:hypothetical protein
MTLSATDLPARSRSGFASAKAGWRVPGNDSRNYRNYRNEFSRVASSGLTCQRLAGRPGLSRVAMSGCT